MQPGAKLAMVEVNHLIFNIKPIRLKALVLVPLSYVYENMRV